MLSPFRAFKNYVAGVAMRNSKDEFETASINLLMNYGIIGILLTALFSLYMYLEGFVIYAHLNTGTLLIMCLVFVVIKKTNNVRTTGIAYVLIHLISTTLWGFALNFAMAPEQVFWLLLNTLIAFFVLGRRWGFAIAVCTMAHIVLGMANEDSGFAYLNNHWGPPPNRNLVALLVPFGLCVFVLREFVRTRSIAETKINEANRKNEELLLNILPSEVAEELKEKGSADAKHFSEVTVLFTDFKNFTTVAEKLSAQQLVNEINYCYSEFDKIISKHRIEKIKTIGDAYMCAGGLPVPNKTNADDAVRAALDIRDFMQMENEKCRVQGKTFFEIRIGLHTGPVVAGIVGIKKFAYDIWGDTVNIASRMESSGEAGKINISGSTYELVKDKFKCSHRGMIQAKNMGEIDMYFVESLN
jgi:class 3 adenylate cyclase